MAATFSRTIRSLNAGRTGRWTVGLAVVAVLLGAWALWFGLARVALYEVTDSARLQVRGDVHPIASAVSGRVVRMDVAVGQEVTAGQVILELDSEAQRLALGEARAELASIPPRIHAIDLQLDTERQALEAHQEAADAATAEARAWTEEAEVRAEHAQAERDILDALSSQGLARGAELRRVEGIVAATEAEQRARGRAPLRLAREQGVDQYDRLARMAEIERDRIALEAQQDVIIAAITRLEHDLDQRIVRAPISGRLGELRDIAVGAVLNAGDPCGTIVPEGDLRTVAFFGLDAAGRLQPGQSAQLRFHGYPWTQYGTVAAVVSTVGQEPVNGTIRVELELQDAASSTIPLTHGLPASVEVEVEIVSPLALVLRVVGKWLSGSD